ncbi:MAG: fumarylacetoacetate hydrolase family protein [Parvibaculum sp.]|nr:fumarylacetoacetate hydrolase family protein [Parvibaculum sp.]
MSRNETNFMTEPALPIASRDVALTFARYRKNGYLHLLLVSSYGPKTVTGTDLTEGSGDVIDDPVSVFGTYGYEGILALVPKRHEVTVPLQSLDMPVALRTSHIAVGTNFPEHAEESEVTDGPFLFPKEVTPTPFNASISAGDGLLDYEAELCFVTLDNFSLDAPSDHVGLVLCNDVTDRAKLLRHVDPRNITSGKGFTTGKSAPGYLPIGTLFVIPKDVRSFAGKVKLQLWRNGTLKQSAPQSDAIWDFDALLRETKLCKDLSWDYEGRTVSLPVLVNHIPARTGLLAGTPNGTVWQGLAKSALIGGIWDWLAGGWSRPVTHWIVERQIARDKHLGQYLQPGDIVSIRVDGLGELRNAIVA